MSVMNDDVRTGAGAGKCKGATQTAGGAGDEDGFSFERLVCHKVILLHKFRCLTLLIGGDNILEVS